MSVTIDEFREKIRSLTEERSDAMGKLDQFIEYATSGHDELLYESGHDAKQHLQRLMHLISEIIVFSRNIE